MLLLENAAVTVTVVADAPSETFAGFTVRLIAGAPSSSVRVTEVPFTVRPVDVPSTLIVSSPSISVSFVGVSVKVALPLPAQAAMVTSKPATAA